MNHPIASWADFGRLEYDTEVIVDSHTKFNGNKTEVVIFGSEVSINNASDGTKWMLYDYQGIDSRGYRTFAKRGKVSRTITI